MNKQRFEKNLHIANELVTFCHSLGGVNFHIDIERGENSSFLTVRSFIPQIEEGVLDEFERELNLKRQREVEQQYWELIGEFEESCEPGLVGMMLDSATTKYENGELVIRAERRD